MIIGIQAERSQRILVFLRIVCIHGDIIHRSFLWDASAHEWFEDFFAGEEDSRQICLECREVPEIGILGKDVMKIGRPAPPMTNDEHRWMNDFCLVDVCIES